MKTQILVTYKDGRKSELMTHLSSEDSPSPKSIFCLKCQEETYHYFSCISDKRGELWRCPRCLNLIEKTKVSTP